MLDSLTAEEYQYWVEYYSVEPFPEERQDLRFANLMILLARINGAKRIKNKDFLIDFWGKPTVKDGQKTLREKILLLNTIYGGRDLRKQK